jgi:hypothetical protein
VVRVTRRDDCCRHRERADGGEDHEPARLRVGAGAEPVHGSDGPREVGEPVDHAPAAQPDPRPQQAGHDECQHQVERDRAEPEPHRPVWREERKDRVLDADRGIAVGNGREHVCGDERDREQRDVAMKPREEHTRPCAERACHA